ncbi:MAG: hypothetical protein KKF52_02225, partial [Nanoarchaeota archaeon]|nr:hypothetical protein [Nanoarchaeota archaeon]
YEGLNFGVNVGLYWTGFPIFSYVLGFGLIKFLTLVFMSVLILKNAYRGAKNIIYKQQFKTFYILFVLFFILGFLDWLVVFGSKFHPGWFIVPPFFILMAYNISRYHIFDIKTTIHKTMAWLLSSLLIYAPFIFMVYLLQIIFRGRDIYLLLSLVVLINIFIVFRNKIQPLLNFVFKKGEVQFNQKITEFLKKLNKNFYLKDLSEDFVKIMLGLFDVEKIELIVNDKKSFKIIKSQVYNQELKISKKNKFSFSSMFLKNLIKIDDILLKEEVEVNPKYKLIKKETLNFFRKRKASIIIPLIFQDKVFAFIIMGSKRGKDYFSINEIQALKNIKEKVTFLFYNSLYFVGVQTLKRNRESLINKEVREKTKQIIEKTEELEKMNKFMVGRELKIRELKQELKRWKK